MVYDIIQYYCSVLYFSFIFNLWRQLENNNEQSILKSIQQCEALRRRKLNHTLRHRTTILEHFHEKKKHQQTPWAWTNGTIVRFPVIQMTTIDSILEIDFTIPAVARYWKCEKKKQKKNSISPNRVSPSSLFFAKQNETHSHKLSL